MDHARSEVAEKMRSARGSTWFVRATKIDELGVVLKRFPHRGDASAPKRTFVLVHGLGVSSRYFEYLAAQLSQSGAVWLIDLPGYGDAPVPRRDVPITTHARVLGEVLQSAGVESPILIGHSMGCQVVTSIAVQREIELAGLVLLSPVSNAARRTARQQIWDLAKDSLAETWRARLNAVHEYLFRGRLPYYVRQVPHMIDFAIEERIAHVTAKTLVVTGQDDPIVPVGWAQSVADAAPRGTLEVVPGAHVVMYAVPTELARRIVTFAS
jgi:pimeloyl-ACP methyl ester carboxylesterase